MRNPSVRIIRIVLTALLTFPSLFMPDSIERVAAAQTEVAFITKVSGRVRLRRGGNTRMLRQATLLNVGDVISADNGGRAVIYQAYAPVIHIMNGQSRTIARLSTAASQSALRPEEYSRIKRHHLNAKQRRAERSPTKMGGPSDAVLTLTEPRNSVVLEKRPTFIWTPVSEATNYQINVYDRNEEIIWTKNTTETQITYPQDKPPLQPGDYKWDVTAQINNRVTDNPALYDATSFTVVSDERAKGIKSDLERARTIITADNGAANLVYISALIEHGQLPQAAAELKRSLEITPQDQMLWELLMETYSQMKLWGSREDARSISDNDNPTAEMVRALAPRR